MKQGKRAKKKDKRFKNVQLEKAANRLLEKDREIQAMLESSVLLGY